MNECLSPTCRATDPLKHDTRVTAGETGDKVPGWVDGAPGCESPGMARSDQRVYGPAVKTRQ